MARKNVRSEREFGDVVCELFSVYGYPLATEFVIQHLPEVTTFTPEEEAPYAGRKDPAWTQKIRNMVSHTPAGCARCYGGTMVFPLEVAMSDGSTVEEWVFVPADISLEDVVLTEPKVSVKAAGTVAPGVLKDIARKKHDVGDVGEKIALKWVTKEAAKLVNAPRGSKVEIEHTSVTMGDGFGYDIMIMVDGMGKLRIEVKATMSSGRTRCFCMSENEHDKFEAARGRRDWAVLCVTDVDVDKRTGKIHKDLIYPDELFADCDMVEHVTRTYNFRLPGVV